MMLPSDQLTAVLANGDVAQLIANAESLCHVALLSSPDNASLLHLRGALALKADHVPFALACLQRAVTLDPGRESFATDYADLLCRVGRYDEALHVCQLAMSFTPESCGLLTACGRALFYLGRHREAIASLGRAKELDPRSSELRCAFGRALEAEGRDAEAVAEYEAAVQLSDRDRFTEGHLLLGRRYAKQRSWEQAIDVFDDGLKRQPSSVPLLIGLAEAQLFQGQLREAARSVRRALALAPRNVAACRLMTMVATLAPTECTVDAANCALAEALEAEESFEEAARIYENVLRRQPDHVAALLGVGQCYIQLNQPAKAVPHLEALIKLEPQHLTAIRRLGEALSMLGHLEAFWKARDRCLRQLPPWRRFAQPRWHGSELKGRRILVWRDCGIGDTILYLRFVPYLKRLGATVIIECSRQLVPLVSQAPYVDGVIADGTAPPEFDTHLPISLLPNRLRITLDNLPADVPYLRAEPALVDSWRNRLKPDGRMLVGITWGGSARAADRLRRDMPLAGFAPLASLKDVRFISLQRGLQAQELVAPPPGLFIEKCETSGTLDETAALIVNLDLVVAVDTMLAHLAGSLGRPVWKLLMFSADCRWLMDSDVSPWYPTMRYFRQRKAGDWLGVMSDVRTALSQAMPARNSVVQA